MKKQYRVAYLVSHPIQYQAPLLRFIAAQPSIDLTVFFLSDLSVRGYYDEGFRAHVQWDVPLLGGYKHVFLPCLGRSDPITFWRPFVYGISRYLRRDRFDALWLQGYANQAALRALAIAKFIGMKVLLYGDSYLWNYRLSRTKLRIKNCILPKLLSAMNGFLATSTANRDFYLHYGVPAEKIFLMPYAVDNSFFQAKVAEAGTERPALRRELGLEENRPVILFASKFQPRKCARDLLEAYIRLSPDGVREPEPCLLFVGEGEERPLLEARANELGWSSVKFLGFVNQTVLPRYYDLCDVFVLPSEWEPFGLVVNEAMNAGKAIIVSDRVGAGPDLVKDGDNGFIFPVGNVTALADRLRFLCTQPAVAAAMGQRSRERIATWGFEADFQGLTQALSSLSCR